MNPEKENNFLLHKAGKSISSKIQGCLLVNSSITGELVGCHSYRGLLCKAMAQKTTAHHMVSTANGLQAKQ